MNREKLTLEDIEDLVEFSMRYFPFRNTQPEKQTIKQYCTELAKEMSYHRNLDKTEGIVK